ncbi:MAG: rhodanese-like domain-containing protein [Ignavibacteriaceae bacterium]|nr:rhodanese-like domain-containing protein [Ignavibacteriaceae bacterium]
MKNIRKYLLLLVLPMLLLVSACKEDSTTEPTPTPVDESKVLVEYLEANGDYLNATAPAIISAADVRTLQLTNPTKLHVVDIRSSADFTNKGHIEGAVNVAVKDIVTYFKNTITPATYEKIAIACYSGQTAGYATALLRLLGYTNVFSLKFGMSAWNDSVANSWKPAVGNNYTNFVTTPTDKNPAGNLPTLRTGKTTGKEILEARIDSLLKSADPFGDARITYTTVTGAFSNYYIVNYWPLNHYNLGHLPGAIQYTPKADLKLSTFLKTLPTNKTVVIYCYTGQTSAQVATILKVLGYDAKSLMFGVSTMNYNLLTTNNLSTWKDTECMYYPFVK